MECAECHKKGTKASLVIDHMLPLNRGGSHDPENIRLVHAKCHHKPLKWYQKLWRIITRFIWKFIPHSHGRQNMEYKGLYRFGQYQIYECKKCGFTVAL